jgi:hypothetical protein
MRCFVNRHALASECVVFKMSYPLQESMPAKSMITRGLLSVIFLWIFVGTIDGPSVSFGSGHMVYRIPNVEDSGHRAQPIPIWIRILSDEPRPVHASFLLFDFKQNLRRWPNVAENISRSPPSVQAA